MKKHLKQNLLALLTAIIWGFAFVAQSKASGNISPFTFNAIRGALAFIILFIVTIIINARNKKLNIEKHTDKKMLIIGGIVCGILLFIASNLQQFGIEKTSPGKAGFLTALYIVIVPILGLFFKKGININIIISVIIAVVGLYFLCIKSSFSISKYDIMLILCAVCFSFHIISIDYFVSFNDGIKLSTIQFLVVAILSSICMLIFEDVSISNIKASIWPLLYAGVISSAIGYTLQILAQKDSNPTIISLILSLESVFSVIGGFIILHNIMTIKEYIGCALMLVAVILAELPSRNKKTSLRM
ncbi:MAG: DMT family transporter [Anaeroplasmataceae bacterium]